MLFVAKEVLDFRGMRNQRKMLLNSISISNKVKKTEKTKIITASDQDSRDSVRCPMDK